MSVSDAAEMGNVRYALNELMLFLAEGHFWNAISILAVAVYSRYGRFWLIRPYSWPTQLFLTDKTFDVDV